MSFLLSPITTAYINASMAAITKGGYYILFF